MPTIVTMVCAMHWYDQVISMLLWREKPCFYYCGGGKSDSQRCNIKASQLSNPDLSTKRLVLFTVQYKLEKVQQTTYCFFVVFLLDKQPLLCATTNQEISKQCICKLGWLWTSQIWHFRNCFLLFNEITITLFINLRPLCRHIFLIHGSCIFILWKDRVGRL